MADNVAITAGSGTTIAADDVGSGVLVQRVKATWGPDGTANDADVATGKPMPVQLRGSDGTDRSNLLPVSQSGTWTVQPGNTANTTAWKIDGSAVTQPVSLAAGATAVAKAEDVASADADVGVPAMAVRKATPANTSGTDGDYEMLQMANGLLWTASLGFPVTCSTDLTRPGDTTAYGTNEAMSDSTSAPASGGNTLTSAARKSGGSGIITDIIVVSSNDPATLLQGELWIFDSAVTNVNDNAAFALSDADAKLLVAVVPFTLASTVAGSGTNSYAHLQGLNIAFTCVGTANLRYLVKVKNAYTPANAEVLTVRAKILQID